MIRFVLQMFSIVALGALGPTDPAQAQTPEAANSASGTQRMAERLEEIIRTIEPLRFPYMNDERAAAYGELLAKATKLSDIMELQAATAEELRRAGRTEEAIEAFGKLEQLMKQTPALMDPRNQQVLRMEQATCYLYQAIDDNCRDRHNADSCLFPISGAGVHTNPRGALAKLSPA